MTVGKEFALLFGVLFLPGLISQTGGMPPDAFESVWYNAQLLAISIPQILLVVAMSELRKPGSRQALGWIRPRTADLGHAAAAYALIVVTAGAAGFALSLLGLVEPAIQWQFTRYEILPLLIVSTLAIGYREELFYRAYLFDRAAEAGVGVPATIAGGASLFALGHAYQGIAGFVVALAVGAVLGTLYSRRRNLHAIAIAHGVYNLTILLISRP